MAPGTNGDLHIYQIRKIQCKQLSIFNKMLKMRSDLEQKFRDCASNHDNIKK